MALDMAAERPATTSVTSVAAPAGRLAEEDIGTATSTIISPPDVEGEKGAASPTATAEITKQSPAEYDAEKGGVTPTPAETRIAEDVVLVEFEPDDPEDPYNFAAWRKWTITLLACYITALAGASASAYTSGYPTMVPDLHTTTYVATVGLSLFPLGFGITPLFTAPFSEEFGRRPVYLISGVGFALSGVMLALANGVPMLLIGQFLSGAFGSSGSAMVGGSLADIWVPRQRGIPMALLTFGAMGGTGFGPVGAAWVEANPHFGWRWIRWFHVIAIGLMIGLVLLLMPETRSAVILTRRARRLRKKTGDERYRSRAELEQLSLRQIIYISATRPLILLCTEPVVTSISIWLSFAWGIFYVLIQSLGPAFRTIHHFGTGENGTVFLSLAVGCMLGLISNFHQDYLYRKNVDRYGPEARLYWTMVAAILFPIGMFVFAWTTLPDLPWFPMTIGPCIFMWATFMFYLAAFSYMADCYGPYASSAIAGQSMARNVTGSFFPLFITQMVDAMTYKWTNTLFGCIAVVIAPIPFILFRYGSEIRKRSKFSRRAMELQQQ